MVTVHRSNIVEDMMSAYVDQDIVKSVITIQFKDECGLDFDGIKREAYSLFWENAIPRYFEGTCTFVPRICPGIEENVYTILGRILWHGYILSGVFPISINKVFLTLMLAGKESINDEGFLDGFLEYVSSYERVKLSHILMEEKLSQESKNFLLDFMSEYAVSKMPENKKSVLISVGKTELSSKPRMAVDALKKGFLCGISDGTFFTKKSVYNLYNDLSVTTDKVLSLLTIDDPLTMTKAEETVFTYFKRYLRNLTEKELPSFLRFLTGSATYSGEHIKVIFHLLLYTYYLPHVLLHTCSSVVDLPTSGYDNFSDFRKQFDEVINNPESWRFYSI